MTQWIQQIIEVPSDVYLSTQHSTRQSEDVTRLSHRGSTHSTLAGVDVANVSKDFLPYQQSISTVACSLQWRGILAMVAGIFQQTLCWGMIMTYGSILTFYASHLLPKSSKTAISLIGVLPAFIVLGTALFWGRLLDAEHHQKVNIFAGVCLTAGLTGLAFTADDGSYNDGQYWQILLASVPIGFGQSAYFLTAPHVAKSWLPNRKGLAMGITNSGSAIGGIIWPFVFTKMTADYSFRAGIGTLAGITAVLGIFIVYASTPGPSFQRRPVGDKFKLRTWLPTKAFRSITFLMHLAAMCCVYAGVLTVPFFIEYWAQQNDIGISEDVVEGMGVTDRSGPRTVYLVVILNACQTPGRLLGSTLCDKFRARKLHVSSCVLAMMIIGPAWLKITTFAEACAFAAVFGLTLGVMVSLPNNDVADILGPNRTHMFGQFAGIVYTAASPFLLGGAVISGAIIDHFDSRLVVFWAIACFGACAILITFSLVLPDDTWKLEERTNSVSSELTLSIEHREKQSAGCSV